MRIDPRLPWMNQAACLGSDPDLFFPPVSGGQTHAAVARAICAICPVKAECLAYALEERIGYGIWGGLDLDERQKLTGGRRQFPQPIKHGTNGGSRAHQRRGEEPCVECKRAHALYHQMRKEQKLRGVGNDTNRQKTHCPDGHPYDEANTHIAPDGKRYCRTCKRGRR